MKIETIHEHTVDTSLLPEGANILDIGCRGFLFANHMDSIGCNVYPVDIDQLDRENESYYKLGISDYNGFASIKRTNDPQATSLQRIGILGNECIQVLTLETFSKKVGVEFWPLIKMDVEGEEYKIIMSLEKAPSKQLSIEFHLHTGIYGYREMVFMENKLLELGYFPVKHDVYEQHGAGKNYWDSLWVLK